MATTSSGGLLTDRELAKAERDGSLDLQQRRLTVLPPEVSQLTNLQRLELDGNQLTALPPEITQLTNLQILGLSGNQLTALPPEITQLTNLQILGLSGNQLTALPPEIRQLASLQRLDLDRNRLTVLPLEIGQLTSLQSLGLSGNQLTALPPEIRQLASLQRLDLDRNRLTVLPQEIGQLTSLQSLYLHDNQLTVLPPEIGQLTSLQILDLNGNQLTALPRQLADHVGEGLQLGLDANPLNAPLPEMVARGSDALAAYLRSLEDAVAQYEAKVLLVGEGNVGKTSLIAALRDAPFVDKRPTTHGIEIQVLTMHHPDLNVDMTVRVWDFGGQQVYRVSHQFFFSRRALYLVVWNAREGQEQNEVEGWLRRIRLRVSHNARTLVVATHRDERRPELDYPQLAQAFPELLAGHYEVDNRSGHGIPELREAIAKRSCAAAPDRPVDECPVDRST